MSYDIGYHVVSEEVSEEHGTFDAQVSIIKLLRLIRATETIPLNVTVRGLDDLLTSADDPDAVCELVHDVLADGVNHLMREQPVIQFVVDDLEYWDEPVITHRDERIPLKEIFYGGMIQEGSDWYSSRLNVTS